MSPTDILAAIRSRRVLVVGDLMLDEYIWGTAERISPEAPVPVVRYERHTRGLGGAANVVSNIQSLGGVPIVCGVVGDDATGKTLTDLLCQSVDVSGVVTEAGRLTTLKTRVMAQRQQMVRIDCETTEPIAEETSRRLLSFVRDAARDVDAIVCSDYDKGLMVASLVRGIAEVSATHGKPFTAGPKPHNIELFAGATLLSLNRSETAQVTQMKLNDAESVVAAGQSLLAQLRLQALTITRGEYGVSLFVRDAEPQHIPANRVEVFDVAGAGDTFLAATILALAAGCDFVDAAKFGNLTAACAVRHVGVVAVTPEDILKLANGE